MKNITFPAILWAGTLALSHSVMAQTAEPVEKVEATRVVTTADGTVSEFGPQGITFKTEAGTRPVKYLSSETTNYVDENGNPVDVALVKSGLPATVYYTKVGDTLIASKIVVKTGGRKVAVPAPAMTTVEVVTTPATAGVITEFGPGGVIVKTVSSADPVRYAFSTTTTYVDENGAPVSVETVHSGLPVKVHYTKVGNELVANKVVVLKSVGAAAPVIEQRTTTTTTTATERK